MKNYYEILGVSKKATSEEIKKAYRQLAKKWHPDACSDANAHEVFVRITEAYEILIDEEKRRNYDQVLEYNEAEASRRRADEERSRTSYSSSGYSRTADNQYDKEARSAYSNNDYSQRASAKYHEDVREAQRRAETYYGMSLDRLLSQVIDVVAYVAKETVKYTVCGEDVELSFKERMSIGFKGVILVIMIILTFTGVLAPLTIPIGLMVFKLLMHKGKFIGVGRVVGSTILFAAIVLGCGFIIVWIVDGMQQASRENYSESSNYYYGSQNDYNDGYDYDYSSDQQTYNEAVDYNTYSAYDGYDHFSYDYEGLIDGGHPVVLMLSQVEVNAEGRRQAYSYYKKYPDQIFTLVEIDSNEDGILLYEYYEGELTGKYTIYKEADGYTGEFLNTTTQVVMPVSIERMY